MREEGFLGSFKGLRAFLSVVSFLRLLVPRLNLFYEEEIMVFLNSFDLDLLPWIVLIIVLGTQLKKMELPSWVPPIPVILTLVSFIICSLFGWAHCEAEGMEAVVINVLEYGIGNGCLIGLTAMWLYDIAHSFCKHNLPALKGMVYKTLRKGKGKGKEGGQSMKKARYALVYPLVCGLSFAAAFLMFWLLMGVKLFYSICLGALACGFAFLVSRVSCNIYEGDADPKTIAVDIYCAITVGGWAGAVFCQSWTWMNIWLTVCVSGLILTLGTRWLKDENQDGIPDIFQKDIITPEHLKEKLLFKVRGDVLPRKLRDLKLDQDRPLCPVNDDVYTVNEARLAGFNAIADEGEAYINSLFKKDAE